MMLMVVFVLCIGVDGRSRGFGMVTFATEGDAERARAMFNGCVSVLLYPSPINAIIHNCLINSNGGGDGGGV